MPNKYAEKGLKTRIGTLDLLIPQVRDAEFYPTFLERGIGSERALTASLAEMYIQGVSTRKASAIIEGLYGFKVSGS